MSGFRFGRLAVIVLLCTLYMPFCITLPAFGASVNLEYKQGYESFNQLVKDSKRGLYRSNWKQLEERFMDVYKRDPAGSYAPKALFFAARVNEELGKRSFVASDYEAAADYYKRLAVRFSKHSWADDSLYRKALISYEKLHDADAAIADLNIILRDYTRGDMYAKALALHRAIRSAHTVSAPAVPDGAAKQNGEVASSVPSGLGVLREIRFQNSNEYTRIVLDVSRETSYNYQILAADPSQGLPFRLYVDLKSTSLGDKIQPEFTVANGILSTVRTGTPSAGVSRIVLDFQSVQKYNVFALDNPYRVVIDVTAPKGDGPTVASSGNISSETPSSSTSSSVTKGNPTSAAGGESASGVIGTKSAEPLSGKKGAVAQSGNKSERYKAPPGSKEQVGELIEQLGLTVKTIMIDAGHGGKDPGAMANSIEEKRYVLTVAQLVGERLTRKGFSVLYTRSDDTFVPLEERTAIANVRKADMFISFHINAHRSTAISGLETYYLNLASSKSAVRVAARENAVSEKRISDLQFILTDLMLNSKMQESKDLASLIQKNMIGTVKSSGYSVKDNGVRSAPFYVLMGAKMPSVLVELGYCTNTAESKRLKTDKYLQRLADGIAKGVDGYTKQLGRFAAM